MATGCPLCRGGGWSLALSTRVNQLWAWFIQDHTLANQAIPRLVSILAITLDKVSRQTALLAVLIIGLPGAIALCYAIWKFYRPLFSERVLTQQTLIWISLLVFSSSWYGWYLSLSIGWTRYLMPAIFVSSIFVSKMLFDLTEGAQIKALFPRLSQALMPKNFLRPKGLFLWLFLLLTAMIALTITQAYGPILQSSPDRASAQAIEYLQT